MLNGSNLLQQVAAERREIGSFVCLKLRGEDLATTSDLVTDALTAFGLSAADSGHTENTQEKLCRLSVQIKAEDGILGDNTL
jgi:hypothetical protein